MSYKSWHITNTRQPKQIRRQTTVCLPNTTVNSDTNASIIELCVKHSECLLSRWKTNCRIQRRNCSLIQQGQIYFRFRGNVYISSFLTLPNTVISLIKAVYKGVRAYVIVIYVHAFYVPSFFFLKHGLLLAPLLLYNRNTTSIYLISIDVTLSIAIDFPQHLTPQKIWN